METGQIPTFEKDNPYSFFISCLKYFNIPENVPQDALSYTERSLSLACAKMSRGDEINLDDYVGVLDEENMTKLINLYLTVYNW